MAEFKIDDLVNVNTESGIVSGKIVEIVGQRKYPMSNVKGKMTMDNRPGNSYVVRLISQKKGRPIDIWPQNDSIFV